MHPSSARQEIDSMEDPQITGLDFVVAGRSPLDATVEPSLGISHLASNELLLPNRVR
jgi:hypothetical protein